MDSPSLVTPWALDPLQVGPILVVALLYLRRTRTLAARAQPVGRWRQASFWSGLGLVVAVLASPVDHLGEEHFFFLHMVQHVVLADLAPLLFVAGLSRPILQPVLRLRLVSPLRVLAHPFVALPVWAAALSVWHVPFLYDAAVRNDAVHAVQHLAFLLGGSVVWAAAVELLPGPEWFGTAMKIGFILVVRLLETILGNVFMWTNEMVYASYRHAPQWGITPAHDLNLGGIVMMAEGSAVTLGMLIRLFLRLAAESETRQRLIEQGLDPRQVHRAVRYGRAQDLGASR